MIGTKIYVAVVGTLLYCGAAFLSVFAMMSGRSQNPGAATASGVLLLCASCFLSTVFSVRAGTHQNRTRRIGIALNVVMLGLIALALAAGMMVVIPRGIGGTPGAAWMLAILAAIGIVVLSLIGALMRLRQSIPGQPGGRSVLAVILFVVAGVPLAGVAMLGITLAVAIPSPSTTTGTSRRAAAVTERVPELNFQIRAPGHPWIKVDAKSVHSLASMAFSNGRDNLYFMVMVEQFGEQAVTVDSLATLLGAGFRSRTPGATVETPVVSVVNGLDGRAFGGRADVSGHDMRYRYWACVHNGGAYELIAWGPNAKAGQVDATLDDFVSRFSLIDPSLKLNPPVSTAPLVAEFYGVSMTMKDSGWSQWSSIHTNAPSAAFGALRGSSGAMMVVPIRLDGLDTPPQALENGFLSLLDVQNPGPAVHPEGPIECGEAKGNAFTVQRETKDGVFAYHIRVLRRGNVACMAAAWQRAGSGSPQDLERILDRVRFDEPVQGSGEVPEEDRSRHAKVFNAAGLWLYRGDEFEQALACFRAACEASPDGAVFATNVVDALERLGRIPDAKALLTDRLSRFPKEARYSARLGRLLAGAGEAQEAIVAYAEALQAGYRGEDSLDGYIRLLLKEGLFDRADEDLARFDSGPHRVLLAAVRRAQGRDDDALQVLRGGLSTTPLDSAAADELLRVLDDLRRPEESLETIASLEHDEHITGATLYYRGRAEMALDRLPEAKASFEQALARHPESQPIKTALQAVTSRLGQADTSLVRHPIEPLEIPPEVLAGIKPMDSATGAVVLHRVNVYRFEPQKLMRHTEELEIKILDPRGVEAFRSMEWEFEPSAERIFVNELTVTDERGQITHTGSPDNYYVAGGGDSDHATESRQLHVPIAGLAPGRKVRLVVSREDLSPPSEFRHVDHVGVSATPIQRDAVVVVADMGLIRHLESAGVTVGEVEGGLAFSMDHIPAYRAEPMRTRLREIAPSVRIGSARTAWPELGQTYLRRIAPRLERDADVASLAGILIDGKGTEEQRLRAIAAHVQESLTYKAITFGPRASVPIAARQTIVNRYGDCKDHALLAMLLMREAGIPAHLALVGGPALDRELPSLDQFDHMIVYLPASKRFLDLTQKSDDPLTSPPPGLAGFDALVLDPEDPRIEAIPQYPAVAARVVVKTEATIEGRDVLADETVTLSGIAGSSMRSELRELDAAEIRRQIGARMEGAEVLAVEANALRDPATDLVLRVRYRVPDAFTETEGKRLGTLPHYWERLWFGCEYLSERVTPFRSEFGVEVERELRVRAEDWTIAAPESLKGEWAGDLAKGTRATDGGVIRSRVSLGVGTFPAAAYAAHADLTRKVVSALERDVTLMRASQK